LHLYHERGKIRSILTGMIGQRSSIPYIVRTTLPAPAPFDTLERRTAKPECPLPGRASDGPTGTTIAINPPTGRSRNRRRSWVRYGLREEDIPLSGRIVSIVDVFDALTHERPYKKALTIAETLVEIGRNAGTQFDPILVDLFASILPDILTAIETLRDAPATPAQASSAEASATASESALPVAAPASGCS
jgi:hypothetical protein